jgi:hypothetical protein
MAAAPLPRDPGRGTCISTSFTPPAKAPPPPPPPAEIKLDVAVPGREPDRAALRGRGNGRAEGPPSPPPAHLPRESGRREPSTGSPRVAGRGGTVPARPGSLEGSGWAVAGPGWAVHPPLTFAIGAPAVVLLLLLLLLLGAPGCRWRGTWSPTVGSWLLMLMARL